MATFAPALEQKFTDRMRPQDEAEKLSKNFKKKRFAGVGKRYYLCPPGPETAQAKSQNL